MVFFLAAVVGIVSAVVAMSHRSPVVNVLSLVVTLFCVAVSYALLGAEFLAAAQILIYAGAILVLFLFVVMLLNAPEEQPAKEPRPFQRAAGLLLALSPGSAASRFLVGIQVVAPGAHGLRGRPCHRAAAGRTVPLRVRVHLGRAAGRPGGRAGAGEKEALT